MVDPTEDETTLEQSNSGESEDQTDNSVENQQDDTEAGKAAEGATGTDAEGSQTRGERRHERYIDKLSKEIQDHNSRSDNYTEELFAPTPYQPLKFEEGAEYDPSQLEEDRKTVATNKFAEGVRAGYSQSSNQINTKVWETNFDIDGERVMAKFEKQLTPDIEKGLVQDYIAFIGMTKDNKGRLNIQKPNIRFKDFAEAEFNKMERYAALKQAESQSNVTSQASKTGMRPTGQSRATSVGHGFDPNDPVNSVKHMTHDQYFKHGGKEASDAYLAKRGLAPQT